MAEELSVTVLESILIETFEATLEIDGVSRESNFFACGGDSLSSLELTYHLSNRLGIAIDMAELPLWSTVSSVAEFLRNILVNVHHQTGNV
jgi:acyl carrier protein